MKKKLLLLLALMTILVLATFTFANDENPGPKNSMPPGCHEHHIPNCEECNY